MTNEQGMSREEAMNALGVTRRELEVLVGSGALKYTQAGEHKFRKFDRQSVERVKTLLQWPTAEEVAAQLGVQLRTVARWGDDPKMDLQYTNELGRTRRYDPESVARLAASLATGDRPAKGKHRRSWGR
jgi:DNA-binding transcriptional MerR regulator